MSGEIKPSGMPLNLGRPIETSARGSTAPGRQDSPRPAGGDEVKVTEQAARLQAIEARLADMPSVDSKRVAELRQAIAEGSYEVDPRRIADKLLQQESSGTRGKEQ